jgi:hypothetical protein
MQEAVAKVLEGIEDDMTDLEKVLYVHDYLVYHAEYDLSDVKPKDSYWAYGIMVNKKGVCDGYTKAFMMLMEKLNIECSYTISPSMNHSWVMVMIEHHYYHVDTSWDDPTNDTLGRVYHEFLMRTDSELLSGLVVNHTGWIKMNTANDTTYLNWEIHDAKSHIIYREGDWYFVDSTHSIVKSDVLVENKTVIVPGGEDYGEEIYTVEAYHDGWLFTEGNQLMYCAYDGSDIREVFATDAESKIRYLHISDDNVLTCTVYNYLDGDDSSTYLGQDILTFQCDELYTEIEYIEVIKNGMGIDTGCIVKDSTHISLDMAVTNINLYGDYMNASDNSSSRLVFRQESTKGLYVAYGWYNSAVYHPALLEQFNISQRAQLTYINNTLVRISVNQTYETTNTLKIGTTKSRLYGCQIWNDGQLIRDYQPVLDLRNVPCLYDRVNCEFYYMDNDCVKMPAGDPGEEENEENDENIEDVEDVEDVEDADDEDDVEDIEDIEDIDNPEDSEPIGEESYTIISYLEITKSNNGIDTYYLANSYTDISLDMAITYENNYGNFINGYDHSCNRITFRQEATNGFYVGYGWYNSVVYKPAVLEKFNITQIGPLTYINNTLVRVARTQSYQMTNSLKIGMTKGRIYGCKIWDNGEVIRDYVPVLDSQNIPCLYDLVTCEFYYGTEAMSYGE